MFCGEIKWDLYISSSTYAKYYFALRSLTEKRDFRANYNVMRIDAPGAEVVAERSGEVKDTFLMSKGHGCMIQYVILEELGIISRRDLDLYCKSEGRLGCHPDYGNPGVAASTGALGHGLSMALGMAYSEKTRGTNGLIYCVISDGEVQEGSTWEATMMASSLGVSNLIVFMDNNDFQSLGRTSLTHPSFYPVVEKYKAFGWDAVEVDGHDTKSLYEAVLGRLADRPLMVVCKTTKGRGISFMENIPIWHYRSPNKNEYQQALQELQAGL
jgi:transketolase